METLPSRTSPTPPTPSPKPHCRHAGWSQEAAHWPTHITSLLIHLHLGTWGESISAAGTPKLYTDWGPTL